MVPALDSLRMQTACERLGATDERVVGQSRAVGPRHRHCRAATTRARPHEALHALEGPRDPGVIPPPQHEPALRRRQEVQRGDGRVRGCRRGDEQAAEVLDESHDRAVVE